MTRLSGRIIRSLGYVLVAFTVQIVGYAALLAVFAHSDPTPLVAEMGALPTPILGGFALFSVPAVALAIGFGTALSFVFGVRPESLPALLLTNGDSLVVLSAAVLAVGITVLLRRGLS